MLCYHSVCVQVWYRPAVQRRLAKNLPQGSAWQRSIGARSCFRWVARVTCSVWCISNAIWAQVYYLSHYLPPFPCMAASPRFNLNKDRINLWHQSIALTCSCVTRRSVGSSRTTSTSFAACVCLYVLLYWLSDGLAPLCFACLRLALPS